MFLISPNAGPSPLAGKGCSPFFFTTSYQNDQPPEVLGKYAQDKGFKKAFLLAPNYQAGKDMIGGFKKHFKGEIADEVYTPLGQLDFSAELAKIAAAKPDAFFVFMPGGMGVNLVKQYRQAGLDTIPFLSVFTVDESTLPAQQDAAVGFFSGMTWAPNTDTPENKKFVADFEKEYGYVPGSYAMQAYDAAQLIDSAVKAVGGKLSDKDALRAAIKKADFKSVRGPFKFNSNGFPVQDFYLVKVAKRADGKFQTEIVQKIFAELRRQLRQRLPAEVAQFPSRARASGVPGSSSAAVCSGVPRWPGPARSAPVTNASGSQTSHVHLPVRRPAVQRAAARHPAVPGGGRADARVRGDGFHQPRPRRAVHAGRLPVGDVLPASRATSSPAVAAGAAGLDAVRPGCWRCWCSATSTSATTWSRCWRRSASSCS